MFERTNGVWWKSATLTPGAWRTNAQRNFFGQSIAISGNAGVLAIGDPWDNGLGFGPRAAPLNPASAHRRRLRLPVQTNWWNLYNMVKPNYHPDNAPYLTFGTDVEFSGNGNALIVGESGESSDAEGISGSLSNLRAPGPERSGCINGVSPHFLDMGPDLKVRPLSSCDALRPAYDRRAATTSWRAMRRAQPG